MSDMNHPYGDAVPSDVLVIKTPVDAIAAVPYMLGFHPSNSVVVLGYDGLSSGTAALRMDSADAGDDSDGRGVLREMVRLLTREGIRRAIVLGYGPGQSVTPAIDRVRAQLEQSGVQIVEALRIHEGRWWSYTCKDPSCCPPEGMPYTIDESVIPAAATVAGHVAYADRSALAESIAPYGEPIRSVMREATSQAESRLSDGGSFFSRDAQQRQVSEGLRLVRELVERARNGVPSATVEEIATLTVAMDHIRVRDEAWCRVDKEHLSQHIQLWTMVLRHAEPAYAAAPASLLAYAAFQAGDRTLTDIALDRALAANPRYTMAHLLSDVVQLGIRPENARVAITPEELESAYAEWGAGQSQEPDEGEA